MISGFWDAPLSPNSTQSALDPVVALRVPPTLEKNGSTVSHWTSFKPRSIRSERSPRFRAPTVLEPLLGHTDIRGCRSKKNFMRTKVELRPLIFPLALCTGDIALGHFHASPMYRRNCPGPFSRKPYVQAILPWATCLLNAAELANVAANLSTWTLLCPCCLCCMPAIFLATSYTSLATTIVASVSRRLFLSWRRLPWAALCLGLAFADPANLTSRRLSCTLLA